jgi:hypothetical protein
MPVTIKDNCVYNPLNVVVSSELGALLLPRCRRGKEGERKRWRIFDGGGE